MATAYEEALRLAESLSPAEQLRLISDVAEYLRVRGAEPCKRSILELQGLGKEIWAGVDAQEYVNHERSSWDG